MCNIEAICSSKLHIYTTQAGTDLLVEVNWFMPSFSERKYHKTYYYL